MDLPIELIDLITRYCGQLRYRNGVFYTQLPTSRHITIRYDIQLQQHIVDEDILSHLSRVRCSLCDDNVEISVIRLSTVVFIAKIWCVHNCNWCKYITIVLHIQEDYINQENYWINQFLQNPHNIRMDMYVIECRNCTNRYDHISI